MTSPRRRRTVAVSVLASLSAVALGTAVDWAIQHDPLSSDASAAKAEPTRDPRAAQLRAEIRRATAVYMADRHRLIRLQHEVGRRAREVAAQRAANAARLAAARAAAGAGSAGSSGGSAYAAAGSTGTSSGSTPAPPPPPPPPPPTQSTTGAS
jgi:hypothetical protein